MAPTQDVFYRTPDEFYMDRQRRAADGWLVAGQQVISAGLVVTYRKAARERSERWTIAASVLAVIFVGILLAIAYGLNAPLGRIYVAPLIPLLLVALAGSVGAMAWLVRRR